VLKRQTLLLPGIVPAFDVGKDIRSRLGPGPILPSVHQLALEDPKETFGGGIIGTQLPMALMITPESISSWRNGLDGQNRRLNWSREHGRKTGSPKRGDDWHMADFGPR